MVASVLKRGQVAIVAYATDAVGGTDDDDIIRFVVLAPIGSGTQIFFSDRNWNGTAFPAAGSGDGTFTYTAGADIPAGTVITITSAQLVAAGMNLSNSGDTIYVYQGTDANTPTTFLFAIDIGDGDTNHVFEAGELTGTGLTAGVDAVAVGLDQASYAGQSTQIPQTQLAAISDFNRWHGHSGDDIGGTIYDDRADTSLSGPLNNPDMQLFVVNNGGGQSDSIDRIDNDEASNIGTNLTRLFRDNPMFTRLEDITFDIEDGVWFAADNEGTDITRILKGSIADLVSGNPNPTITVVYDYPNNGADGADDKFIQGIEIDTASNRLYFTLGDGFAVGHNLMSIDYNGGSVRNFGPIDLVLDPSFGFVGGIEDFVIDVAHNTAYFSYVLVNAGAGQVLQNYVVRLTAPLNAAAPNPAVENYAIVNIANAGPPPAGYPAGRIPDAEGSIRGMDYDAATNTVWFVTGRLGAAGTAGIFTLNLTTLVYTEIWQQPSNNANNSPQSFPTTLLVDIEVDSIGGRYYVTSLNSTDTPIGHDGTATDENGSRIWSGSLTSPIGTAPTFFASVFENTANGAGAGMEIDYAPTTSITGAGSTYTESTNLPGSPAGPTVDVGTSPTVSDPDQTIIQGATVAISTGFVAGDQLTFTNSGGITGSYNSTTGVITFTGNAGFAAYQTVLDSVRFTNAGDNPTDYGASTSRIISFTVFDGLINSDPATATVTVVGINDAPVNTIQGAALAISEDAVNAVLSTTGNAISVFDVDANPATQDIRVTLSVTQGTLTILTNVVGGIVAGDITGGANGTNTITITATQNQINATLAASNGLLYNPIADYNGSDTLTIVTNDLGLNGNDPGLTGTGTSEQDSDTRTINIAAVADIANDTVNIAEDAGAQNLNLLGNDTFENAGRAITAVGTASHGTVTINDNGTPGTATDDFVVYTPTADYNGSDSFTYTVTSGGVTEQATVTVNISAVQDIAADTIPLNEDAGPSQLDLLANDSFENAGRSITAVGTASHGTVTINNNGTAGTTSDDYVVYTPTADYNGSDSFTYTVTSGGVTEQATATINIAAVADIADDSVTVAEDSGTNHLNGIANISLLANDSFENAGRAITAVGAALHGTTAINNNGTAGDATDDYVTYTPTGNYAGPDSFTYTVTSGGVTETATVTVNVTAVNDDPINAKPGTQTINEDATLTFSTVGGNAISVSDIDAAPGMLTVTLAVVNGQLTLSGTAGLTFAMGGGDGTDDTSMTFTGTATDINAALNGLLYETTLDYNGTDTLTITTNDNGNTGTPGALQDMDTVTINITAVADIANDTVPLAEDAGATQLDLLANDSFENPGRSITAVTQGLHGFVSINDNNTVGNTADDYVVYTAAADYNGADSFTYTVTSGGVTETATVNVNISAVADIANDTATVGEDGGATTIDVIANDSFENGGFSITAVTQGLHGTVAIIDGPDADLNPDYVSYTPSADYNGTDSFTYTVTSGGVTETATVNVTISAVADIVDDAVGVLQDSVGNVLNLLANDTFESSGRAITAVGAALHGTTAINNNGTPLDATDDYVTYTPTGGYTGPDSFTYTVTSGGVTETATVSVNVAAANIAPAVDLNTGTGGIDDTNLYVENGSPSGIGVAIGVTDADAGDNIESATITITDPEAGDLLSVTLPLPPGISVDTVNSTATTLILIGSATPAAYAGALGQVGYENTTNDPTDHGTNTNRLITVVVNDGTSNSAPATMTMSIATDDDPSVAQNDALTTDEATTITGSLFAAHGSGPDTDPDSTPVVLTVNGSAGNVNSGAFLLPSGALLTVNSDGTFTYNPNNAFNPTPTPTSGAANQPAPDSFTYELVGGSTATVNISVNGLDTDDLLLGTSGADTMNGGIGNDTLFGLGGVDILFGGDGNDAIEGGTGTDGMYGGTGNDAFYVDAASDYLVEASGEGTDIALASVSYGLTAGVEVEILSTTLNSGTGAIDLYGNEFDNTIYGNAGANLLSGDGGSDVLVGLGGNDLLSGDDGDDTLDGGANDDILLGGAGVDILLGGDGNDALDGGTGTDGLYGGDGNDSYYVDQASDYIIEAANRGTDLVYASASYALAAGSSIEILSTTQNAGTGAIDLTGNELDNIIYGNAGINVLIGGVGNDVLVGLGGNDLLIGDNGTDTLDGGLGNDTLLGGALADTLLGGDGDDVIDGGTGVDSASGGDGNDSYFVDAALDAAIETSGQGTDVVYASASYTLTGGSHVEILSTTQNAGTGAIDLTGNELANVIYGNAGANVLNGGDGNDSLIGFGGADTFAFTTALGAGNVDVIGDFVSGTDKIALDDAVFSGLGMGALPAGAFVTGSAAADADDRIIYDSANGNLYYDADGNGAGAAVLFANLQGHPVLIASDFQVI